MIGIKAVTYSTYENGTREIPAEILVRLSILFDVPTDVILQKDRLSKSTYVAQNQIDEFNNELQELKDIISAPDSELNPQFADMMKAMTDAFTKMNEQLTEFNNNNNNGKNNRKKQLWYHSCLNCIGNLIAVNSAFGSQKFWGPETPNVYRKYLPLTFLTTF